ncbi:MarR family transcriptional regulator [Rothia sp. AR01]|uniref:MarR family transcriptional regulator n=1 Tax=Rothia santali TaxID=2949643 RepID=A0A9X2HCN0_9MICC|nr:MarR family transcriptional regulator [Rothia santali]MCP3426906.1 MarR family transcriptional regulator [Rothia santali]
MAAASHDQRGTPARVLETLEAIQGLSERMDHMHGELKASMGMNATDIATLRMLIMRERTGEAVSPRDISRQLNISTASTTTLLDRLVASGHVERIPHPEDRRARVIVLTEKARGEFFAHFGHRLAAMRAVAAAYDDAELAVVNDFLARLEASLHD